MVYTMVSYRDIFISRFFISIYDRPKGRKKKYNTPEELAQAKRDTASKHYYDNYEYRTLQIKLYKERVKEKNNFD